MSELYAEPYVLKFVFISLEPLPSELDSTETFKHIMWKSTTIGGEIEAARTRISLMSLETAITASLKVLMLILAYPI